MPVCWARNPEMVTHAMIAKYPARCHHAAMSFGVGRGF
jgi:hypothetical protein